MWDGVTAGNLPTNAQLVAGYLTGRYAWSAADWARFPNSVHVGIATQAQYDVGVVLDVETGDATPAQAPGWVTARRAAGIDPTVYCNSSTWPEVRAAFQSAGVVEPWYWIAHYDLQPTPLPAGAVAKQYQSTAGYDLSSVANYWPGVDHRMAPTENPNGILDWDDVGLIMKFGNVANVQAPGQPINYVTLGSVLRADPVALIRALATQVTALSNQVAALSTVSGADPAALAKAVCDEQDRRAAKRAGTVV
jgi:hypothetical protein